MGLLGRQVSVQVLITLSETNKAVTLASLGSIRVCFPEELFSKLSSEGQVEGVPFCVCVCRVGGACVWIPVSETGA